jgi:hypothetical protein
VSYLATAAVGHRAAERAGANGHDKEIHVRLSVHATLLVRGTAGAGVANREDIASWRWVWLGLAAAGAAVLTPLPFDSNTGLDWHNLIGSSGRPCSYD